MLLTKKRIAHHSIWLSISLLDLVIGFLSRYINILVYIYVGILCVFLYVDCSIIIHGNDADVSDTDILIVLGHQLDEGNIGTCLKNRLNKAIEVLKDNEKKIIVTGGYTGSDISEAEAMKNYLVGKGIAEDRILVEDESMTTIENFENTIRKYPETKDMNIGIISSEYHLLRARRIAKRTGYTNIKTTASKSEPLLMVHHMTLEKYLLLTKK